LTPHRLGPPGRQFLALHHAPDAGTPDHGVVLCNPFGQEAVRAHRLVRILAERLARGGLHALRFDYVGSGDSDGDDADGSLASYVEDTQRAVAELRRLSGASRISLFGLRLGATVALLASARAAAHRLVLWDPVVSGRRYLDEIRAAHRAEVPGSDGAREILGFALSPALEAEIAAITPDRLTTARGSQVHLIASPLAAEAAGLEASLREAGVATQSTSIESAVAWASEEAMNAAMVPADGLQAVLRALEVR
jgi:pimeloyl-ACP methyl ester carboxylesterase